MDEKSIAEGKSIAWLSYLWILVVIPLIVQKDNAYTKFHAKQGIVLLIVSIGLSIAQGILCWIPFLGRMVPALTMLLVFIWMVIGIVNSLNGKADALPLIGRYAEKLKF